MSTAKGWEHAPDWMNAEDREREEQLLDGARKVVIVARAAAHRLDSPADLSGWQSRVDSATKELQFWIERFDRLAPESPTTAPADTPPPPDTT